MTKTAKTKPKTTKPRPKTDRRILRTRDALGDAMMALLHEKSFDQITVQEVLDRAGVGRATFYAHYRDKHDLFLSDVEEFLEHVSGVLKRQNANPRRLLPVREFLTHIRDVREFHAALVKSDKLNEVWTLARGFFARSIEERSASGWPATRPGSALGPGSCSRGQFLLVARLVDRQRHEGRSKRNGRTFSPHGLERPDRPLNGTSVAGPSRPIECNRDI